MRNETMEKEVIDLFDFLSEKLGKPVTWDEEEVSFDVNYGEFLWVTIGYYKNLYVEFMEATESKGHVYLDTFDKEKIIEAVRLYLDSPEKVKECIKMLK